MGEDKGELDNGEVNIKKEMSFENMELPADYKNCVLSKDGYENIVYGPFGEENERFVYKETNWENNIEHPVDLEAKTFLDSENFYNWSKLADETYSRIFGDYYLREEVRRVEDEKGGKNVRFQKYIDGKTLEKLGKEHQLQGSLELVNNNFKSINEQRVDIMNASIAFFMETGILADVSDSNIIVDQTENKNSLQFFDAGPMAQLCFLINSGDNIPVGLNERLVQYLEHMDSHIRSVLGEKLVSIEYFSQIDEAKKDPIGFIKSKSKKA